MRDEIVSIIVDSVVLLQRNVFRCLPNGISCCVELTEMIVCLLNEVLWCHLIVATERVPLHCKSSVVTSLSRQNDHLKIQKIIFVVFFGLRRIEFSEISDNHFCRQILLNFQQNAFR